MNVLIFNAGSSSLTYKIFSASEGREPETILAGKAHRVGVHGAKPSSLENSLGGRSFVAETPIGNHREAAALALGFIAEHALGVDAVGHRFVHGGRLFDRSAILSDETLQQLRLCLPLAPIHNPNSLSVLEQTTRSLPGVPQYVTFDSAFHSTIPPEAYVYPLPARIQEKYGFRRYGFHGLSYFYISRETPRFLKRQAEGLRIVACHLGTGGSSVAAIRGGKSLDTSMGYSPLPGLIMSTRCGDIDPMLMIYLMAAFGYRSDELSELVNSRSGLLGISGYSSDLGDIVSRIAGHQEEQVELAFRMYVLRLRKYIGGFVAALGGLDALVFTDDIGVRNSTLREYVCEGMEWCGIALDWRRNRKARPDEGCVLSPEGVSPAVLSIPTQEERVILHEGLKLMGVRSHDDL